MEFSFAFLELAPHWSWKASAFTLRTLAPFQPICEVDLDVRL